MALKPITFDFDAARRAYAPAAAPEVKFLFMGEWFTLISEPLLGDTFDLRDAPEHAIGENDLDTIRVVTRFVRMMLSENDRPRWDDAIRRLPVSQAYTLVELLEWITRRVTTFPTSPPADSSAGRRANGRTSRGRAVTPKG